MNTLTSISEKSQFNGNDKKNLLNIQKGVSFIGLFFAIILATNLFLLEAQQVSMITQYLAWAAILAAIFFLVSIVWAFQTERKITVISEGASDNVFSRVILFASIFIGVQFSIYYIVYEYAHSNLSWYVQWQANEETRSNYLEAVEGKSGWSEFLSISLIFFLVYTIFCAFANGGSRITLNLQVYLVGIALAISCFQAMYGKRIIEQTYENPSGSMSVTLGMTFWICLGALIFLLFTFLANAKRLRLPLLLLGTFFIVTTALMIPAVGDYFEAYRGLGNDLSNYNSLSSLDAKYIENLGCPAKYEYSSDVKCPSQANAQNCFHDPQSCTGGNSAATVWESYLKPSGYSKPVYACLNTNRCSGLAKVVFSEPMLMEAIYALQYALYSFILGAFCYQLSSQERGSQIINSQVQLVLMGVFVIVLIVGSIYQVKGIDGIQTQRDSRQVVALEKSLEFNSFIAQDSSLSGYASDSGCSKINDLLATGGSTFINALQTDKDNQKIYSLADLEILLHSDDLPANNQCQTSNGQQVVCNKPGYMVVIEGPSKDKSCSTLPQFIYQDKHANLHSNGLRYIAPTTALSLLSASNTPNTQTLDSDAVKALSTNSYMAFAGDNQAVLQELREITICYLNGCDTSKLSFNVRVIKLDLSSFYQGESEESGHHKSHKKVQQEEEEQIEDHQHDLKSHTYKKSLKHQATTSTQNTNSSSTNQKTSNSTSSNPSQNQNQSQNQQQEEKKVAANTSGFDVWGNQQLQVQIFDVINNKPLEGAKVRAYRVADNSQYDGLCNQVFSYQPDLNATSTESGKAATRILYTPLVAENAKSVEGENYITYYIVADLEGYHSNCRQFSFGYKTLPTFYQNIRVGLTPRLQQLQARAVLEWDNQFVDNLHLWTAFSGNDQDQEFFDCIVGPYSRSCQDVYFDETKVNPTESVITFKSIGQYDYLVYFNRQINNVKQAMLEGRITTYAQDILAAGANKKSINPIIKYYTGDALYPLWASSSSLVQSKDLKDLDTVSVNDETGYKTPHYQFSVLEFCLNVKETHSLKPVPFSSKNYLWSQYKGMGTYNEAATYGVFPDSQDTNDDGTGVCEQLLQQKK